MLESERHGVPAWSGVSLDSQGCPLLRDAGEMQKSCCEASSEDEPSISLLTQVGPGAALPSTARDGE